MLVAGRWRNCSLGLIKRSDAMTVVDYTRGTLEVPWSAGASSVRIHKLPQLLDTRSI